MLPCTLGKRTLFLHDATRWQLPSLQPFELRCSIGTSAGCHITVFARRAVSRSGCKSEHLRRAPILPNPEVVSTLNKVILEDIPIPASLTGFQAGCGDARISRFVQSERSRMILFPSLSPFLPLPSFLSLDFSSYICRSPRRPTWCARTSPICVSGAKDTETAFRGSGRCALWARPPSDSALGLLPSDGP